MLLMMIINQQKTGGIKTTNTALLKKILAESGLKMYVVAQKLGLTTTGLKKKIDNITEFKASEIDAMRSLLNLSTEDMLAIFFARKDD